MNTIGLSTVKAWVKRSARANPSMIAGATAVQIGTANFVDPFLWRRVLDGLQRYVEQHRIDDLSTLIGSLDTTRRETGWISS